MTTWRTARWAVVAVFFCVAAARPSIAQDVPAAGETRGETRTWTDISGKFSREAEFLELAEGKVRLRLSSGKEIAIPLKELSKKDRDWVRANGAALGAAGKQVGSRIVLRSYQTIVDDSIDLSRFLKQGWLAGAVPGFFVGLTGGKPLDGFDVSRPITITMYVDAKGEPSGNLVAVPVLGKDRFQKTLDAVFARKTTPAGRGYEIGPAKKIWYVKPGDGYFLVADSADLTAAAAADPQPPAVVADLALETFSSSIPEEVRQTSLAQIDQAIASIPVEGDAVKGEVVQMINDIARSLNSDIDRITLEASLDRTTKTTNVSVAVRAHPSTPMAGVIADYGALRPRFAGPGDDASVGWMGMSLPASALVREFIRMNYGEAVVQMRKAVEKGKGQQGYETAKKAVDRCEEQVRRLLEVSHYEQEALLGIEEGAGLSLVSRVAYDGAKDYLAAWLDIVKLGVPGDAIVKDADGIVSVNLPASNMAQAGFSSKHPLRALATDDALVFGIGCADTKVMKAMVAGRGGSSSLPPLSTRIDVARLWPAVVAANPVLLPLSEAVGPSGTLRADVTSLSDGIELRVGVDASVLGLVGTILEARGAMAMPGLPGRQGSPGAGVAGGLPPGFPPAGPPAGGAPPTIQGFPVPPIPQPGPAQPPTP